MSNLSTRPVNGGMSRPFADLWGFDPYRAFSSTLGGIEISRTEAGYTVEIPVAGFKPDQIDITLENGTLLVTGKNDKRTFTRSIVLPDEVDSENITANVEHGMLTLGLNFVPKAQPKKITVRTGNG